MYRRTKFLEILDEIREKMSREADYDVDLFAEMVRQGKKTPNLDKTLAKKLPKSKEKEKDLWKSTLKLSD